MPLAKSSPQPVEAPQPLKEPTSIFKQEEPTHIEFYRYFEINPIDNDSNEQLSRVYKWAAKDENISESLRRISTLESKLGAPKLGETRLGKLYNWIRLSEQINNLREGLDNEIGSITQKTRIEISRIKEGQLPELEKLNSQIEEKKQSLNNAIKRYRLNMTEQAKNIKNRYERELNELKTMRSAFKGAK